MRYADCAARRIGRVRVSSRGLDQQPVVPPIGKVDATTLSPGDYIDVLEGAEQAVRTRDRTPPVWVVAAGAGWPATQWCSGWCPEDQALLEAVQRPISPACITAAVGHPLWKDR